MNELKKSKRRW